MSNTVYCDISISADGYLAGPGQTADRPFGDGPVERLHAWRFDTPDGNQAEADRVVAAGAFVMGRNMFGPIRGDWDLGWRGWRGWWGETPPCHAPVSVLTHHPRDPLTMQGGTTFTFVTDGIGAALDQARGAAGDRDVAIAGAATVNQYLAAGPIDELRTHIAPVTLGAGHGRRPRRARGRSLGSTGRATTPVRRGTSRMNEITKYVFSNTLEEATWTSGDHRPRRRRRRGA